MKSKLAALVTGFLISLAVAAPSGAASPLRLGVAEGTARAASLSASSSGSGHALIDGPVMVGDARRFSELAQEFAGVDPADEDTRGLAHVAYGAVSGLSSLSPASRPLTLSGDVAPAVAPTLYSRVVGLAGDYQLSRIPGAADSLATALAGEASLDGRLAAPGGPRLAVPDLQLAQGEARSSYLAELGGIHLSGRLSQLDDHDSQAYDLVASLPVPDSNVGVSAHYRLVDVDRLAGEAALKTPARQTMGVGGEVALTGGTLLKAGYEVTRDGGALTGTRADADLSLKLNPRTDVSAGVRLDRDVAAGPQVRTSLGVGYQLSGDAALRASYTLINFGAEAQKGQDKHVASAEVSLRF